jgi:hypothetical protein
MPVGDAWLGPWLCCSAAEPLLLMVVLVVVVLVVGEVVIGDGTVVVDRLNDAFGFAFMPPIGPLIDPLGAATPPPALPWPPPPPGAARAGPAISIAALPVSAMNDFLNMRKLLGWIALFHRFKRSLGKRVEIGSFIWDGLPFEGDDPLPIPT